MKKKIIELIKKYNCRMENYNSYRSDLGWQVFEMLVFAPNGKRKQMDAGYIVGNPSDKEQMLPSFENDLQSLCR